VAAVLVAMAVLAQMQTEEAQVVAEPLILVAVELAQLDQVMQEDRQLLYTAGDLPGLVQVVVAQVARAMAPMQGKLPQEGEVAAVAGVPIRGLVAVAAVAAGSHTLG
jgi:hypothetical protein